MLDDVYERLTEDFTQGAYNIDRSRGFQLIGIRAAYVTERLSEVFGLLGNGWRYAHSPYEVVEKEVLTEVALQYRVMADEKGTYPYYWDTVTESFVPDRESAPVWSEPIMDTGGNQIGKGGVPVSDARKSALSGALSKAASRIGVGISAYKGQLEIDGEKVVVKEESGASPTDTFKAARQIMGLMFANAPEQYDKLVEAENPLAVAYNAALLKQAIGKIDEAGLREFVVENLSVLVGNDVKNFVALNAGGIKRVSEIVKSIDAKELTWQQALEVASAVGLDESWDKAVSDYLKDDENDDDSEGTGKSE